MSLRYYDALSAERLRMCYHLAPREVQAYLSAETDYILDSVAPGTSVLELGCGYGRVLLPLASARARLFGIDLSLSSLRLARPLLQRAALVGGIAVADVLALPFPAASFDLVFCPQNGISAFHLNPHLVLREALRVVKPGGRVQLFSYAEEFWPQRLAWFRLQAQHGLIGPINEAATGQGTIVCNDGFTATTFTAKDFLDLTRGLSASVRIAVLHASSLVCDIVRT